MPVGTLLGLLGERATVDEFLAGYLTVERWHAVTILTRLRACEAPRDALRVEERRARGPCEVCGAAPLGGPPAQGGNGRRIPRLHLMASA